MAKWSLLALCAALLAAGCNEEPKVSSDQEKNFRTPPKEIPADIAAKMAASRARGMAAAKSAQGGAGGSTGQ